MEIFLEGGLFDDPLFEAVFVGVFHGAVADAGGDEVAGGLLLVADAAGFLEGGVQVDVGLGVGTVVG